MPAVGDLVRPTEGAWMVLPPRRCPQGHSLGPGRVLVGRVACRCGQRGGHDALAQRRQQT